MTTASAPRVWLPVVTLLSGLGAAAFLYSAGLPGAFVYDDGAAISQNPAVQLDTLSTDALWAAIWSSESGPLKRPLSMLSFALNHYTSGLDPAAFKWVNICIHLLTAASLAFLAWQLMAAPALACTNSGRRAWLAVVVALVWLLHPLHVSTVLYTVQRMTGLASLLMTWGLIAYVHGRSMQLRSGAGLGYLLTSVAVFLPAAALSKETGLLLLPYILVVECFLFRLKVGDAAQRRRLYLFLGIAVAGPILLALAAVVLVPGWWMSGYDGREFTLLERVLTQPRILLWYLRMILLPNVREMGLHHDDIELSRDLLEPLVTLPALLIVTAMPVLALVLRKAKPILAFGLLWFTAGHALESTVLPLNMAHEHRNYLPAFGIIFSVAYYAATALIQRFSTRFAVMVPAALVLLLAASLQLRAAAWSSELSLAQQAVRNHPASAVSHWFYANAHLKAARPAGPAQGEHLAVARKHLEESLLLKPEMVASQMLLLYIDEVHGEGVASPLLQKLVETVSDGQLSPSDLNALWLLTDCQVRAFCHLEPREYLSIILNAAANPSLSRRDRAKLFEYAALFLGRSVADYAGALFYTDLAIEEDPAYIRPRYRRVEWLANSGDIQNALAEVDKIESLDQMGAALTGLQALRAQLHAVNSGGNDQGVR
ncbi:MAG: hypothetical protein QNJ82_01075 [Gammaproteobacteria bacterium]|nr:hypothetical protein [Gammaproteobacteria bacterium]